MEQITTYRSDPLLMRLIREAMPFRGITDIWLAARAVRQYSRTRTERVAVLLPTSCTYLDLTHDVRKAPVAVNKEGNELPHRLVSLSDEKDTGLIAVVDKDQLCPVVGIGIDLCAYDDFSDNENNRRFSRKFFDAEELGHIKHQSGSPFACACARAFSAKEAAFKSTSRALRLNEHTKDLPHFTIREFKWQGAGIKPAQSIGPALADLGIDSIALRQFTYRDMVLSIAAALGTEAV